MLSEAGTLLAMWQKDLKGDNMKLVPSSISQKLKSFATDTEKLGAAVDAADSNVTIEFCGYSESPDKTGLDRLRKVVINGSEYDTSAVNSVDVYSGSVFGSASSVRFLDYSTGAQMAFTVGINPLEMARSARGGGKLGITVSGVGKVYFNVKADRPPPDVNNLASKQKILGDLN